MKKNWTSRTTRSPEPTAAGPQKRTNLTVIKFIRDKRLPAVGDAIGVNR